MILWVNVSGSAAGHCHGPAFTLKCSSNTEQLPQQNIVPLECLQNNENWDGGGVLMLLKILGFLSVSWEQ